TTPEMLHWQKTVFWEFCHFSCIRKPRWQVMRATAWNLKILLTRLLQPNWSARASNFTFLHKLLRFAYRARPIGRIGTGRTICTSIWVLGVVFPLPVGIHSRSRTRSLSPE